MKCRSYCGSIFIWVCVRQDIILTSLVTLNSIKTEQMSPEVTLHHHHQTPHIVELNFTRNFSLRILVFKSCKFHVHNFGSHIKLDLSGWFSYQCLEFKMVVIGFEYNLQSGLSCLWLNYQKRWFRVMFQQEHSVWNLIFIIDAKLISKFEQKGIKSSIDWTQSISSSNNNILSASLIKKWRRLKHLILSLILWFSEALLLMH